MYTVKNTAKTKTIQFQRTEPQCLICKCKVFLLHPIHDRDEVRMCKQCISDILSYGYAEDIPFSIMVTGSDVGVR